MKKNPPPPKQDPWYSIISILGVFNTTFNNISAISWWSVLLMEETRVHGENHQPVASH